MSTSKKIFLRIIPIVFVLAIVVSNMVFATSVFDDFNANININGEANNITSANQAIKGVWNTVKLILQILAVAAVVVAGVRYMFASADAKADIKKQSIGLVVGAILVFAASYVIQFVVSITQQVTGIK